MFRRLTPDADTALTFTFNGQPLSARKGESIAAALLAADVSRFRSHSVDGSDRAPLCMMGCCFECLVTVDGQVNRQACLVRVRQGMQVCSQQGRPLVVQVGAVR